MATSLNLGFDYVEEYSKVLLLDLMTTNYQLTTTTKSMAIKILIPTALQKYTNDQATIECSGNSVAELLDSMETHCPGIKARLCDEQGKPRRFLNFYVNSEDIRFLEGISTALKDGDEVSIVPAVAGG